MNKDNSFLPENTVDETNSEQTFTDDKISGKSDLIEEGIEEIANLKSKITQQIEELSKDFPPGSNTVQGREEVQASGANNKKKRRPKGVLASIEKKRIDISTASGFGQYLRNWRLKNNLSQSEVAKFIGCRPTWYSMLEAGEISKPNPQWLAELARLYNQNLERFFRGTPFRRIPQIAVSKKAVAGFCPNPDCPALRFHWTAVLRKGILSPQYYSMNSFKPRKHCGYCGTGLITMCSMCSFPIQHKGERYCASCNGFMFLDLISSITSSSNIGEDGETAAVNKIASEIARHVTSDHS